MDNTTEKLKNIINDNNEIKVKSHRDGQSYTLKEILVRIEKLEDIQQDIRYFLQNPKKLNSYL